MNVVGTVDGAVTHVDTVKDTIVVAVEGAANAIDNDDAVDVQVVAYGIILCFEPTALDTVTSSGLVGSSGVLVGVGTAVTKNDRIGHKVTVAIGVAEDGKVLHWLSVFELAVVLKLGTAWVDGAVVKVIRRAIEVEVGAAMGCCEPSIVTQHQLGRRYLGNDPDNPAHHRDRYRRAGRWQDPYQDRGSQSSRHRPWSSR